jgi:hypothetical protein
MEFFSWCNLSAALTMGTDLGFQLQLSSDFGEISVTITADQTLSYFFTPVTLTKHCYQFKSQVLGNTLLQSKLQRNSATFPTGINDYLFLPCLQAKILGSQLSLLFSYFISSLQKYCGSTQNKGRHQRHFIPSKAICDLNHHSSP